MILVLEKLSVSSSDTSYEVEKNNPIRYVRKFSLSKWDIKLFSSISRQAPYGDR